MIQGLLGKKLKMSRWFDEDGNSVPVTLIELGPCYVTGFKDNKVQIGYREVKKKSLKKPQIGFFKKNNLPFLKYLKSVEWLGDKKEIPAVGEKLSVNEFEVGEKIDVQGESKGRGFTGTVKRWGFSSGPHGHGSRRHRIPGSIGGSSDPSRVWPGLKMAGRDGGKMITEENLKIVYISKEENVIAVKGAVPGPKKNVVFVRRRKKSN
ncbi:MAG: 50S ribosomal protein L3 [Elusimicrobiota bacterium]